MGRQRRRPNRPDTPNLAEETAGELRGGQSDATMPNPPAYIARRPARQEVLSPETARWWADRLPLLAYLARHTFTPYRNEPEYVREITEEDPGGKISERHLEFCYYLDGKAEARLEKLEQKATASLAIIALFAPFVVSLGIYLLTLRESVWWLAVPGLILSLLATFISLTAALRALSVRAGQDLSVATIVDEQSGKVKKGAANYLGRALLWAATTKEAHNDLIADFVRASQVYCAVAILGMMLSGVSLVFDSGDDVPVTVAGTVSLDTATLQQLNEMQSQLLRENRQGLDSLLNELRTRLPSGDSLK